MAQKKGGGSTRNGRDSNSKRLGVKRYEGVFGVYSGWARAVGARDALAVDAMIEALALIEQVNGPEWARFGQEYEGSIGAKMSLGRHHALPFDMPYSDLVFPDGEQAIATRLGASDRLIVFDDLLVGPFGTTVRSLTLRHHQIPSGLAFDAKACEIELLSENAGFEFNLGVTRFRYSRLGIERLIQSNTTKDKGART